jgi:ubiquinone/menaquinone biosynthesis C-methylase UbiE
MTSAVVQANIDLHTVLADSYDESEPHFRRENKDRVRAKIEGLQKRCDGNRLLDLGCGTGFMIGLSKDIFTEIHGVDVTQAMLDRVDRSGGNITLHLTTAESVPFSDDYFDLVTAYSFLHHTEDYRRILREAFRVLKPGGVCYTAQDPNRLFWTAVRQLNDRVPESLQSIVAKAYDAVLNTDAILEQRFGTPQSLVQAAEPVRAILGGLDPTEVEQDAAAIGFRSCEVRLEWFLGEAEVMHGQSSEAAAIIDAYLRSASPLTNHLFKYVQLTLVK